MRLSLPFYIFGWLVACTFLSANPASANLLSCGEFAYNPTRQSCCGGRIHVTPVALGVDFRCCGDDLYPLDGTLQCCGTTTMDLRDDAVCCNNEVINSTTHECCGDRHRSQRKHTRQEGHECCGTSYYTQETQTCCGSNDDYSFSMHVADGIGSCCGSQTYDASTQICCPLPTGGKQSHSVGEYGVMLEETECCGAGWINTTTHICCQNVAQQRGNGTTSCYGNQAYDSTRQVVCGSRLLEIQDGKTECCDNKLINPNDEPCCAGFVRPSPFSCCGYGRVTENYNPTESSCVGGERMELPEVKAPTMLWKQCGKTPLKTTYADTLHLCCDGQLTPRFPDSDCCGSKPYRSNNQFCVNYIESMVVDKITPNASICTFIGQAIDLQYDPETQTCCRDNLDSQYWRVFNGTQGKCCLLSETVVTFTDPSLETCCKVDRHQEVHATPEGEGECCGPEMLIKGKQLCDTAMGEVVDIPENHPNHNDVCVPQDRVNNNIRQTYDNQREFCSNAGEIIPKAEGKDLCGGQIYDLATHSCCARTIYRLVTHQCCADSVVQPIVNDEGLPLECCGVQAYHSGTSTCFKGSVKDDIPEKNAGYCGSIVYDNSRYDCVDGYELVPQGASPHMKLCGRTMKVYDDRLQECCGEDLISPGQTCCHGYRYETPGTTLNGGKCCGATGYNPSMHICCIGSLSPTLGMVDPACCMHQAHDSSVSNITCCGGKLSRKAVDETECFGAVVHRPDEIVCDGVRHPAGHMLCCGSDLYNPSTELCCDGFRYMYEAEEDDTCCGNKPYQNTSGHLCCDGTLHTQAEGKECCNRAAFYPSTHQCFTTGGQNIVIEHLDNTPTATNAFCTDGSYNPTNQTCCDGLLYNGFRECCGNQVIEAPSEDMCCGDVIQWKIYGDESQCCPSGQIMHQSTGCDSNRPDLSYQLCNETEYFPLFQGCCAGTVYSSSDAQCRDDKIFLLCGDEFYSQEEKTCCNGSLMDVPNGECCENTAFDPNSSICCEGNLRRIRRGRDQCCGVLAFDVTREMCCETGPVRMTRINQRKMQNGLCCGEGFEPNFETRHCEEVPLLCKGLERSNLWKEASDDCSKDFTFSFIAGRINANDTYIKMEVVHHLLAHNSNIHLDTLVLPAETKCRRLSEGETYVAFSSGDVEGSSLLLRNEDFLGRYQSRIASRLLRRTCS